jgi:nitroreductase
MGFDNLVKKRHSVRRFTSRRPDWRKIIFALDTASQAPLAGNVNTRKYILVDEKDKIKKLAEAAQQPFIKDVEYVVVFCTDINQSKRAYGKRAEMYSKQQAGAAIQTFLLKLTEIGMATCWVGAFHEPTVKKILNIPEEIEVEAFFPIGYELGKTKAKPKPELNNNLFFNEWKNKFMNKLDKTEKG